MNKKHSTKKQVKNFAIIGAFNTLLDIGLSYALVITFAFTPVLASICSTSVCFLISFYFNRKHTFKIKGKEKVKRQVIKFTAVTLFTAWVVQSLIIEGILKTFNISNFKIEAIFKFLDYINDWQYLFAKCAAIGVCMCLNFYLYKKVVFK